MRKFLLALALVAVATTAANAQLNLFYDVRPTIGDIDSPVPPYTASASLAYYFPYVGQEYQLFNSGARGDGQMVFISPKLEDVTDYTGFGPPDGFDEHLHSYYTSIDWSTADIYLYAEFLGTAGEVVSSIGITQEIPAAAFTTGGGFYLQSVGVTPQTTTLWDGYNFVGADDSISMKMVQVPVAAGPVFDNAASHLNPGDVEQIAKFQVTSEYRNGESAVAAWGLKLAVNELLVTRVSYPTAAPVLPVYMGYAAGSLELWGDGTNLGGTNATDDMTIVVIRKGDFDADGVPASSVDDFAYFDITAFFDGTNCNPFEMYLADFDQDGLPASSIDDFEYYKHVQVP